MASKTIDTMVTASTTTLATAPAESGKLKLGIEVAEVNGWISAGAGAIMIVVAVATGVVDPVRSPSASIVLARDTVPDTLDARLGC